MDDCTPGKEDEGIRFGIDLGEERILPSLEGDEASYRKRGGGVDGGGEGDGGRMDGVVGLYRGSSMRMSLGWHFRCSCWHLSRPLFRYQYRHPSCQYCYYCCCYCFQSPSFQPFPPHHHLPYSCPLPSSLHRYYPLLLLEHSHLLHLVDPTYYLPTAQHSEEDDNDGLDTDDAHPAIEGDGVVAVQML